MECGGGPAPRHPKKKLNSEPLHEPYRVPSDSRLSAQHSPIDRRLLFVTVHPLFLRNFSVETLIIDHRLPTIDY
jgi:hypothetical protein